MPDNTITESYYVASAENGYPQKIFFNSDAAFASTFLYLDSFDPDGNYITSYNYVDGKYEIDSE